MNSDLSSDIKQDIKKAFKEDIPTGDITTDALDLASQQGLARLKAKEDLVLSACEIFEYCILLREPKAQLHWQFNNADPVYAGQFVCDIEGDLIAILQAERVALNYLGYFSGIASSTRKFVEQVQHTKTKILDTRKTFPGWRLYSKKAVRDGGGHNHRIHLSDKVLIKENHIRAIGGFSKCLQQIRQNFIGPIEVETTNLEEVELAVKYNVERIMLDNMDNSTMAKALEVIPETTETEASGNMSIDRVQSVAELGVDFISVGAITHSAPVADLSLLFDWDQL